MLRPYTYVMLVVGARFIAPECIFVGAYGHTPLRANEKRSRQIESGHMWAMMLSPNALHLISVAPSIKRAKS